MTIPRFGDAQVPAIWREIVSYDAVAWAESPPLTCVNLDVRLGPSATVYVDGAPWAHFDGNTVFLPDVPGIYAVKTRQHGGGVGVHVRRTAAPLRRCAFALRSRQLLLSTALDPARPPELPYTAVLTGPRPTRVDNGEVLDDAELRHADAETRAQALAGGVVIRFRSGITKVHYGE